MTDFWSGWLAVVFLGSVAIAAAAGLLFALFGPGRYTLVERITYAPAYTVARVLWRVEIQWDPKWNEVAVPHESRFDHGMLRDRIQGGAILVANHRSSVDPFFIQLAAGCRVHWMVTGEYFRHVVFGPLLRSYQAIPTNRGGMDNAATKRAIRYAKEGDFVGMFPEGRINRTQNALLSIRPGAAMVAAKADVPIVPIWIEGAPIGPEVYSALFMAARVKVLIGFPCKQEVLRLQAANGLESLESQLDESLDSAVANNDRASQQKWICHAMGESLRLGQRDNESISLAGRRWLDS